MLCYAMPSYVSRRSSRSGRGRPYYLCTSNISKIMVHTYLEFVQISIFDPDGWIRTLQRQCVVVVVTTAAACSHVADVTDFLLFSCIISRLPYSLYPRYPSSHVSDVTDFLLFDLHLTLFLPLSKISALMSRTHSCFCAVGHRSSVRSHTCHG